MKIILFANTDWYLYNFRLSLAHALRKSGLQVLLISPPGPYSAILKAQGFRWKPFVFDRRGMNPLGEVKTILRLARIYRLERPDMVNHFTPKCILYGSSAARLARVPAVMNTFTGMGYLYTAKTWQARLFQAAFEIVLRLALYRVKHVASFHNPEDRDQMVRAGIVSKSQTVVIRGAGVDTSKFVPRPEREDEPLVVLPARMLWDKGVGDFVEAARLLKKRGVRVKCVLVGMLDKHNPAHIPRAQVEAWEREGVIEWWGHQDNIADVLASSHIVVLPSYREGLPLALVEAAACARPIVSTDIPGCREIVRHGENGFLVRPKDSKSLAQAIATLVEDPILRVCMGARGRQIVVDQFSSEIIQREILTVYHQLLGVHLDQKKGVPRLVEV